jgi:hypothetical protein
LRTAQFHRLLAIQRVAVVRVTTKNDSDPTIRLRQCFSHQTKPKSPLQSADVGLNERQIERNAGGCGISELDRETNRATHVGRMGLPEATSNVLRFLLHNVCRRIGDCFFTCWHILSHLQTNGLRTPCQRWLLACLVEASLRRLNSTPVCPD